VPKTPLHVSEPGQAFPFGDAGPPDPPIGLSNPLNICYLNALLQSFFHIPQFTETLLYLDFSNQQVNRYFEQSDKMYYPYKMTQSLQTLFKSMIQQWSQPNPGYQDPKPLLKWICDSENRVIDFGEHRDATEFMAIVIDQVRKFIDEYQKKFEGYYGDVKVQNLLSFNLDFMKGFMVETDA
jgi:uncharacterized UBP type Zn finger protein